MAEGSSEAACKTEYEVLQDNLSAIVEKLGHDFSLMCVNFFEKRLISDYELGLVKSQPAYDASTTVVMSILAKAKANSDIFYTFVEILQGSMPDLAQKLTAEVTERKGQHNPATLSQSSQPSGGNIAPPSQLLSNLQIADDAPKLQNELPTASMKLNSASTDQQVVEKDSAKYDTAEFAQPTTSTAEIAEMHHTTYSTSEVLRFPALVDTDLVLPLQPVPKALPYSTMNQSSLSFSDTIEKSKTAPYSEPASQGDVFNISKHPIQVEAEAVSYSFISHVKNEPLASVKDQNFWAMDSQMEKVKISVENLKDQLDSKKREIAFLKSDVEKYRAESVKYKTKAKLVDKERDQAVKERDQAVGEKNQTAEDRDRTAKERDQTAVERDRALEERDQAVVERDRAVEERDQAVGERDRAVGERDRAVDERDRAVGERDRAVNERDRSTKERDQVVEETGQVTKERDQALKERDEARLERDNKEQQLKAVSGKAQLKLIKKQREHDKIEGELKREIASLKLMLAASKSESVFFRNKLRSYSQAATSLKEEVEKVLEETDGTSK